MIGVGNLALPNALHQGGLVLGALFLTTGAILGIWSNRCLMTVAFKTNTTKYSDLVEKVLGKVLFQSEISLLLISQNRNGQMYFKAYSYSTCLVL